MEATLDAHVGMMLLVSDIYDYLKKTKLPFGMFMLA